MSTDSFEWHTKALKGERGPIYDGQPESGWYRQRRRDKTFEPVAYWKDTQTGEQRCHINGKSVDLDRMMTVWPYASRNPISAETYWAFIDTGKWPDVDAAAHAGKDGPDIDPEQDPVGSLKTEIEKAAAGLAAYKTIESDEASARALTLRSELTGLKGKAVKAYEAANRPLLDEQERIRKIWFPLRDQAERGANDLRKAMEGWEDTKRANAKLAAEAAAKEAARIAEENARKIEEFDKQAAAALVAGKPAPEPPKPVAAPAPPKPNTPAPLAQIKGGSGRTASVSVKPIVVSIDIQKAFDKFGGLPEVYNVLMELAQRAIDAKTVTAEEIGAVVEDRTAIR